MTGRVVGIGTLVGQARLYVPVRAPEPTVRMQIRHDGWKITQAVRRNLDQGGRTVIPSAVRRRAGFSKWQDLQWESGAYPVRTRWHGMAYPTDPCADHPVCRDLDATTLGGVEVCSPCHPGWFRAAPFDLALCCGMF